MLYVTIKLAITDVITDVKVSNLNQKISIKNLKLFILTKRQPPLT